MSRTRLSVLAVLEAEIDRIREDRNLTVYIVLLSEAPDLEVAMAELTQQWQLTQEDFASTLVTMVRVPDSAGGPMSSGIPAG